MAAIEPSGGRRKDLGGGERRDPSFTTANLFWWYNMAATYDIGVTPRPIYKSDGRKLPDCYTQPLELRDELTGARGLSPCSISGVRRHRLQPRAGSRTPLCTSGTRARRRSRSSTFRISTTTCSVSARTTRASPASLREIDAVAGELIADAERDGARVIVLSEYGITPVSTPIHINRALREAGLLRVRREGDGELLDPSQSEAFAVSDHQIAHVYVAKPHLIDGGAPHRRRRFRAWNASSIALSNNALGLDHPRSGELVALARRDAWFTYYYWLDDRHAPDFARLVEIHRKPGYDPVELFLDPAIRFPKLAVGWRLARRALGLRTLMDVIPLDATLVKGSHGRVTDNAADGPIFMSSEPAPDTRRADRGDRRQRHRPASRLRLSRGSALNVDVSVARDLKYSSPRNTMCSRRGMGAKA